MSVLQSNELYDSGAFVLPHDGLDRSLWLIQQYQNRATLLLLLSFVHIAGISARSGSERGRAGR